MDEEILTQENENFSIDSDKMADWAVQKIKEEAAERDRLIALCDEKIAELQEKKKTLADQHESKVGFLKSKLFEYFQKVDRKETKTQESYKLVSGSIVLKKSQKKIVKPADNTALLSYLEANEFEEFVETKKTPKWADFKKTIAIDEDGRVVSTDTGELLHFLEVEQTAEVFDVK